jgi:hypothetical protein
MPLLPLDPRRIQFTPICLHLLNNSFALLLSQTAELIEVGIAIGLPPLRKHRN